MLHRITCEINVLFAELIIFLLSQGAPNLHQGTPQADMQQGSSNFTLQLFQHTLQETLSSFQKSIHEDVRNLHIEILRQFHMQEVCDYSSESIQCCMFSELIIALPRLAQYFS